MVINTNPKPEMKSKSTPNSFKPTIICLKKLKLLLNSFGSAHFDQNSTDIQKVKSNKDVKNGKLIFYIDYFAGV